MDKVKLDGKEVTQEKLTEQKTRNDVRVKEVAPQEFKSLKKMKG